MQPAVLATHHGINLLWLILLALLVTIDPVFDHA